MSSPRCGLSRAIVERTVGILSSLRAVALRLGAQGRREHMFSGRAMGTYFRITLVTRGELVQAQTETLRASVAAALERVESLMSTYRSESELSQFNAARHTDWIPVSRETALVVREAIEVGCTSGGVYDVTVGPLVNLWSFGPDHGRPAAVPSEEELARAKSRVGLDQLDVRLDPPALRKHRSDLYVDLASIAKGFGVDRVAEALDRAGLDDYCVDVGGEIRTKGCNARGIDWHIAIERPVDGDQSAAEIVPLSNLAMATSGDYRIYFEVDGVRYSHEIDPRTGWPIHHALASVTVVDPSCMRADAWATALLVAGPEAGYAMAVEHRLAACFLIKAGSGFETRWTPGFEPLSPFLPLKTH